MEGFTQWLGQLPMLTRRQRGQLLEALRPAIGLDRVCEATKGANKPPPSCPSCKAERRYRHGHDRGLQRYRCRACGKTFTALSGTLLSRLRHRANWLDYLDGNSAFFSWRELSLLTILTET
jgi:ribosomal protein L37AE/L43A